MNSIPIFSNFDDTYAPVAGACIASVAATSAHHIDFHILDGGISEINRGKLKEIEQNFKNLKIHFIQIPDDLIEPIRKTVKNPYYPIAAFYRLLIPMLRPDLDRAVYIDCDTIAMTDIAELYSQDLDGKQSGAAEDCANHLMYYKNKEALFRREILPMTHTYFNAGVLLLDCRKLRENNYFEKLVEIQQRWGDSFAFADNSLLNKYADMHGGYKLLDRKYNVMTLQVLYYNATGNPVKPALRHFNGSPARPWMANDLCKDIPNGVDFFKYAAMTPFNYELMLGLTSASSVQGNPKSKKIIFYFFGLPLLAISSNRVRLFGFIPLLKIKEKLR